MRERSMEMLRIYDKEMAKRVFGYLPDCGFWGVRQCPVYATKVPDKLVTMCDRILENKVPNVARAAPPIAKLEQEIMAVTARMEALS
jgi:hypothetical protein